MRILSSSPWLLWIGFVGALLAGSGCPEPPDVTSDAGPDAPDADAGPDLSTVSVEALCQGLQQRICDEQRACGCSLDGQPYNGETCEAFRADRCALLINQQLGPVLDDGDVLLLETTAQACFDALDDTAADCRVHVGATLAPPCALLFVDRASLGETCVVGLPGGACAGGEGLCDPQSGACSPAPVAGGACLGGGLCGPGLFCDDDTVCQPPPAPAALGAACAQTSDCALGLVCGEGGVCAAGPGTGSLCSSASCGQGEACERAYETRTCAPQSQAGAVCVNNDDCAGALVCLDDDTCGEAPAEGEACTSDGSCADGATCDFGSPALCVRAPGIGEPCVVGPATCADGLGCDENNLCAAPPGDGEPCLLPQLLCAEGTGCSFEPDGSICRTQGTVGDACTSDRNCQSSFCDFNVNLCTAFLDDGAPCPNGNGCAPASECNDLGGGFTCQPVPDEGDPCYERCGEGFACVGAGGRCQADVCLSPIP